MRARGPAACTYLAAASEYLFASERLRERAQGRDAIFGACGMPSRTVTLSIFAIRTEHGVVIFPPCQREMRRGKHLRETGRDRGDSRPRALVPAMRLSDFGFHAELLDINARI